MAKYKIIPSSRTIVQSPISIGHKAEKGVEAIEFDLTAWVETYGSGTLTVIMRRWGDAIPYPIALEIDENNKATWTLSDIDTAKAGMAYAQLSYIVGETVVKKSDIYTFRVMDSLTGEGEPPEAYESWLEHLTHLAAEAMAEVLDIEGIVTDKTLTVDGGIADAKAAGDALALKADKSTTYTKTEVDQMIEDVEVETDTTLAVSGAPADSKKVGDELTAIKADLGAQTEALSNIIPIDISSGVAFYDNKAIQSGTGNQFDATNYSATGYISIDGCESILYSRYYITSSTPPSQGMAFYDENKAYISGIATGHNASEAHVELYEAAVPEGAKYVRLTLPIAKKGELAVYDKAQQSDAISTRIPTIAEDVEGVKTEVSEITTMFKPVDISDGVTFWDGHTVLHASGGNSTSSSFKASGYVDISGCESIIYPRVHVTISSNPTHGMAFYDENKTYISGIASVNNAATFHSEMYTASVPEGAMYAKFTVRNEDVDTFAVYDAKQYNDIIQRKIEQIDVLKSDIRAAKAYTADAIEFLSDKTNGVSNAVARMRLLTDIEWVPLKNVPKRYKNSEGTVIIGSFTPGEPVKGIPYAAQLKYQLWAGKNISFETFLSSLNNSNSVIYDYGRVRESGLYKPGAWYSINCSKSVSFALGIKQNYASGQFNKNPNINQIKAGGEYTVDDIRIGDIIENPAEHTAMVTDLIYDVFGDVVQVEVGEAVMPTCRRKKWNVYGEIDNFWTKFGNTYNLLRYDLIDSVSPIDMTILYPYISKTLGLNYGNRANYKLSDTVTLTLLDKISNTIVVTKDGSTVQSIDVTDRSAGDTITLTLSTTGYYYINFDNGADADAVTLCMVDASVSYDSSNNKLTFSGFGTPYQVECLTGVTWTHINDRTLTAEEIANGYMTITPPAGANYIHVSFKTLYGVYISEVAL